VWLVKVTDKYDTYLIRFRREERGVYFPEKRYPLWKQEASARYLSVDWPHLPDLGS
jgi:hypothetical protein